jgi:hypothetical protein
MGQVFHSGGIAPLLRQPVVAMFTVLLAASAVAAQANDQTYDAAADFSLDSNPNGIWSYGRRAKN